MQTNRYLAGQDPERDAARRLEIKRDLAKRQLNQQRICELQAIARKLDDDCDTAASEHAVSAGVIQSELDRLDAEHVDLIVAGKTSSAKSLQRRSAILAELASLNMQLQTRCEANKRSKIPLEKQIFALRSEVAAAATLENQLQQLAGPDYRVKQVIDELTIQAAKIALGEAMRREAIHAANYAKDEAWDKEHRRGTPDEQTIIHAAKLADAKRVCAHFQSSFNEALKASEETQRLAIIV